MSKRLHELANRDKDLQQNPNFCPIHDDINDGAEPKTCADCKEFKTHRTINVVLVRFHEKYFKECLFVNFIYLLFFLFLI